MNCLINQIHNLYLIFLMILKLKESLKKSKGILYYPGNLL